MSMMLISFLFFFVLFSGLGVISAFWRKETVDDYLLASRSVPSWLVGLSFGATISSGATFVGFAGLAYHSGIVAAYTVAALMIGDYIGWRLAGDKIRKIAHEKNAHTYPSLIGKFQESPFPRVTMLASLLSIFFMGIFCAAQIMAGAKIGETLFGWDFNWFVFLGAAVLMAYCWAGGIRASIWTDALQALIILLSLIVLIVTGLDHLGGFGAMWSALSERDAALTDLWQLDLWTVCLGWLCVGIGILGQPQLMVRHMVARCENNLIAARRIYVGWRVVVLTLAVISGMIARVMLPETEGFDPELSVPQLWAELLSPALVGLLIAGLFSSTMSTADSLLLSCSSALTQHVIPKWRDSYAYARLGTLLVIVFVVIVALTASKGVLSLVVVAWSGMAAALVPMIVVQLLGAKLNETQAVLMMLIGFGVAMAWRYGFGLDKELMELVPGMVAGFAVYAFFKFLEWKRTATNKG